LADAEKTAMEKRAPRKPETMKPLAGAAKENDRPAGTAHGTKSKISHSRTATVLSVNRGFR